MTLKPSYNFENNMIIGLLIFSVPIEAPPSSISDHAVESNPGPFGDAPSKTSGTHNFLFLID